MDHTKPGLWLLPSRRRIANLHRFFEAAHVTNMSTPGMVLVDRAEYHELKAEYDALPLPANWSVCSVDADSQGDKIRAVWADVADKDWVGLLGDDCVPITPDWDKNLIGTLQGWNFVSCNDAWQAPGRIGNCWVWSGDLLRAVGYAFPPKMQHLFIDDLWETLGAVTRCLTVRMDIIVRHNHATLQPDTAALDTTHWKAYSDANWSSDTLIWEEWQAEGKDAAIAAVEALKASRGVAVREVDVSNVKLMIATPSGSGKFVTDYVTSLFGTTQLLTAKGVPFKWVVEGGNADIAAARAELIATFWYSDFTHLLMIDDDMGWDPNVLSRLLMGGKDFISIAGRKKRDTPIFALNPLDNQVTMDGDGCCEVKEVGMAFSLVTRECIAKMIEAYPELKYRVPGESFRYSLCLPTMTENVYKGEDYAFCLRWRAIGGKVYVCPDLSLKHVGVKTWEGAWTDMWQAQTAPAVEAAE